MPAAQRRLAAIMFTDIVGFASLAQSDESAALSLLERHNRLLRALFGRFHGREVKATGDGFLVEFVSALEAAECALEAQRTLRDHNARSAERERFQIRIGIHVGDAIESGGDLLGDAVNIAARIQPLAPPGGICVSQQVFDLIQNKIGSPLVRLPTPSLKNIRVPVALYRILLPWEPRAEGVPPSGERPGRRLAVLPLANISPDPGDAYFADGLTEELISTVSQLPEVSVIARTSVAAYRTAPKSVAEVAAELGVDTVLEGSVRKAGNQIRISLQLIDAATQGHLWARSYDRKLDDVFAVQTDIAERTASALQLELGKGPRSPARRAPTANLAAYDLYLRGLVAASDRRSPQIDEAVRCFREATTLDPEFVEAFAAWADFYVTMAGDELPMPEVMPKARELAARALELDPESSEAHAALANITFQADHDWAKAESEFRRAIALNPSNVGAHRFFGLMLLSLGRFEEGKEVIRTAMRLDPRGNHWSSLALGELWSGHYDAAVAHIRVTAEKYPESRSSHIALGFFLLAAGRREEARREADAPFTEGSEGDRFDHALLEALLGHPGPGRAAIAEAERGELKTYVSTTHLAIMHAALGEGAKALDLLEEALRLGDNVFWLYFRGIWFDAIRSDPRFLALLRAYGLPGGASRARAGSSRKAAGPSAPRRSVTKGRDAHSRGHGRALQSRLSRR